MSDRSPFYSYPIGIIWDACFTVWGSLIFFLFACYIGAMVAAWSTGGGYLSPWLFYSTWFFMVIFSLYTSWGMVSYFTLAILCYLTLKSESTKAKLGWIMGAAVVQGLETTRVVMMIYGS